MAGLCWIIVKINSFTSSVMKAETWTYFVQNTFKSFHRIAKLKGLSSRKEWKEKLHYDWWLLSRGEIHSSIQTHVNQKHSRLQTLLCRFGSSSCKLHSTQTRPKQHYAASQHNCNIILRSLSFRSQVWILLQDAAAILPAQQN